MPAFQRLRELQGVARRFKNELAEEEFKQCGSFSAEIRVDPEKCQKLYECMRWVTTVAVDWLDFADTLKELRETLRYTPEKVDLIRDLIADAERDYAEALDSLDHLTRCLGIPEIHGVPRFVKSIDRWLKSLVEKKEKADPATAGMASGYAEKLVLTVIDRLRTYLLPER